MCLLFFGYLTLYKVLTLLSFFQRVFTQNILHYQLFTDSKCVFRIKSKSFLISLILKYNLEPTCVYSCKGVYSKKLNAVIVSLDESNLDLYNIIEPQG